MVLESFWNRLRLPKEEFDVRMGGEAGEGSEVIKSQPDLLPVLPLPAGPRKWGLFHLTGSFQSIPGRVYCCSRWIVPRCHYWCRVYRPSPPACACALNGWVGTVYGINFPIFARASFGVRGTSVAIVCRMVAAIVWFGTQTYQGGQCVSVMLKAIWPSFAQFPNHLPPNAHVTSGQLLCFFIFYAIQLPLLWIHISKLRYLFMIKVIIMPIFGFILFGWAVTRAHGFGPIFSQGTKEIAFPAPVLFFSAMTSAIAPKATMALNICDFTRYAKSPRTVLWTNIFSLSILVTLCAVLGVIVTSAVQVIYGITTWNPLQVSELWDNRAAAFFSAVCWALAVIATNISANSTAVGNDLALLFPSFIDIRRGQYICAILGVAACPWIVQNSAKSFVNFLGGYSIFLGPICGIMLSDFFIYRKRTLHLASLYRHGKTSTYWYDCGFNPRALIAFTLALIPNIPGFIHRVNPKLNIPIGAEYVFSVVWPLGVFIAGAIYLSLSYMFPPGDFELKRQESAQSIQSVNLEEEKN